MLNIKRKGFTLAEVAVVIAIFVIMVVALTPFVGMIKNRAETIACANDLKLLSLGLHAFAADHKGIFPRDLRMLYPDYVNNEKAFHCPASKSAGTPERPDYEYIGGLTENSPPIEVIAYDSRGNHKNRGRNLLRVNGAVEWVREGEGKPK
jgi:prepilin-type N-terminal cleavage/methylation domain-containing protein